GVDGITRGDRVAPGGGLGVEAGRAVAAAEDASGEVSVRQGEHAPVLLEGAAPGNDLAELEGHRTRSPLPSPWRSLPSVYPVGVPGVQRIGTEYDPHGSQHGSEVADTPDDLLVHRIPDRLPEGHGPGVILLHQRRDAPGSLPGQSLLDLGHQGTGDTLAAVVGVDRQPVEVAPPAVER